MNSTVAAVIITACLLAAVLLGIRLRRLLPSEHLNQDTRDSIKIAMGLVATMTALVLGLLVSSAKGAYDTTRTQVIQMAAKVAFLDRILDLYGPDAVPVRAQLRQTIQDAVAHIWPKDKATPQLSPNVRAGDAFFVSLLRLSPRDETQRALKSQASILALDLGQARTHLVAQSVSSISAPLLIVVVCWLVILLASFSLLAPGNSTATLSSMIAALSVAAAIFLILELDHPFRGIIRISSEPLRAVLDQPPQ